MKLGWYAKYAWIVLLYTLAVIVWGGYVRASGSGAGCGEHWPLCNGVVVPRAAQIETIVELSHRLTTSLSGLLVIGLVVGAFRGLPKGHPARVGAAMSLGFVLLEGAVGAVQVKLGLVADNQSVARAFIGAIHLVNTFLLVAAMGLTAWWASGGQAVSVRRQGFVGALLGFALLCVLLLGATGSITALGDTLFPVSSLREGMQQDFSPTSHFLIRLRVYHPLLAIAVGVLTVVLGWVLRYLRPSENVRVFSHVLTTLFMLQLAIGALNLYMLAPVAMQLFHLLMADIVWLALVLLCASALVKQPETETVSVPNTAPSAS